MSLSTNKELNSSVTYYTVYLRSNDTIQQNCDVLLTARKNFFETNKKQKNRVFLNVQGESIKYNYCIENNKPIKWKRENENRITQRVILNSTTGYAIETLDYSGAVVKKEYYNNQHKYEKSEYFDGFSEKPYKTLVPLITDKVSTFALYLEDSKKPIMLKSIAMPTDKTILSDFVLTVSPELAVETSNGFSYLCSETKVVEWNNLIKEYENNNNFKQENEDTLQSIKNDRFIFDINNLDKDLSNMSFNIAEIAVPLVSVEKPIKKDEEKPKDSRNNAQIIDEVVEKNEYLKETQQVNSSDNIKTETKKENTNSSDSNKEITKSKETIENEDTEIKEEIIKETKLEQKVKNKQKVNKNNIIEADKEIEENTKEKTLYFGKLDDNSNRIGYGRTLASNGKTLYDGEYNNDMQNGFGISYFKTGRVNYVGNWIDNKRNGFGISIRPTDGCVQVGSFKEDKLENVTAKFDKNGKLMFIENHKDDTLNGANVTVAQDGTMLVTKWQDGKLQKNATILNNTGELVYTGGIKSNKKDGNGMLFSKSGNLIYKGSFKNDEYNGNGTMYFENGMTIEGVFKDNKINGNAVKRDSTGKVIFKGNLTNNKYNGEGTCYFKNGTYKTGNYVEGKPVGEFSFYTNDNQMIYKGALTDDVFDGKGAMYQDGEMIYSGTFSNGEKFGIGREFLNGVCTYMGEFEKDHKNGFGTLYHESKVLYTGYFKDDVKNGNGIEYEKDAPKYVGMYNDDKLNGRVNIISSNKLSSECIFKDGQCVYARQYSKDGTLMYDGSIKENLKDGMGCTFDEFGDKVFEGIFKNDEPFKSMKVISKKLKPLETDEKLNTTIYKEYITPPSIVVETPITNGVYSGQVSSDNVPNGKGTMLHADHKYVGMFKDGIPYGNATIYFDNGDELKVVVTQEKTDLTKEIKFMNISYNLKTI